MSFKDLIYEKKGRIAYVTINRPEVMNALTANTNAELYDAFCDFRDDPESWIAIITGAGERAFCAGNDLKATAANDARGGPQAPRRNVPFGGITSNFECYKPIIAAVNGYAVGGGCEIILACDIVIAAEHARFGLPEPRVGLVAGAGGVIRLPRQIPLKIAMGMMLTGKQITAQEAHRVGLVNEVVPRSELMATAERWAGEILECAPFCVRGSKEAGMRGLAFPVDIAMQMNYEWTRRAATSEDRIEGPKAFAEKRKPEWKGR